MRLRYQLCAIAALFIGACSANNSDSYEIRLVKKLEENLILPEGTESLRKYNRTYAVGQKKIRGVLIITPNKGKISIVPESHLHMERMDGGCGAIQVTYDRVQKRWTDVVCNGSA